MAKRNINCGSDRACKEIQSVIKLSIAKRNLNSDNDAAGKPGPRLERSVGLRQLSLVKHDIKRDNSNQIMPAGLGKAHLRLKLSVTKRNITGTTVVRACGQAVSILQLSVEKRALLPGKKEEKMSDLADN